MLDFLSAPHLTGDVKDVGAEATRNLLRIVENPFVQRTTNVLLGFLGVLLAYKVVGGLLTKASVLR